MTPSYLLHDFKEAEERTEGCILCFLERRQVMRYLGGVASDGVNNIPLRQKLAARGGYCAAHSADFAALASPLSAAILLESFLQERLERAGQGKRPVTLRCEACEVGATARQTYAKTIRRNHSSPDVQTVLLNGKLCLDHLELLCRFLPVEATSPPAHIHDRDDA